MYRIINIIKPGKVTEIVEIGAGGGACGDSGAFEPRDAHGTNGGGIGSRLSLSELAAGGAGNLPLSTAVVYPGRGQD